MASMGVEVSPWGRRSVSLAVCGVLVLLAVGAQASPPAVLRLVTGVSVGDSLADLESRAAAEGLQVAKRRWTQPGAMSDGLLDSPNLLALLNRHKVRHSLFSGLPGQGPEFLIVEARGARAVWVGIDGKLWAAAMAWTVPVNTAVKDHQFSPARLQPYRDALAALSRSCERWRATRTDRYGNRWAHVGDGCLGGRLFVDYDPREKMDMSILLVPGGRM